MAAYLEKYQYEAYEWLHDIMNELGIDDRDQAVRVFRAVLHALRDRIPVPEAIHFAAQLPVMWKGIYFDGFTFHAEPQKIRKQENWLNYIRSKTQFSAEFDFPTDYHAAYAYFAVMRVLERRMNFGQIGHLRNTLHHNILWPEMQLGRPV